MMELNSLPVDSGGSGGVVGFHAPTSSGSTSATSSATTTPMAGANGNTLGAGAVSPVAVGDSASVHRVGHKRSHSRDAAPGGSGGTLHWFAVVGDEKEERRPSDVGQDGDVVPRPGSATRDRDRDREREERARGCREKQEEDRRRKLEELKQQALAAQKFREQQEEERKRHIEEVRERESQRRQLVEERKRALVEADRERKEQIIKRNQERDERMDTRRRHERGQIVFAFGSSTPRMASDTMSTSVFVTSPPSAGVRDNNKDVADNGGTFWGHRRSTSSFNVNSVTSPMPMANSPPFAVGGGGGGGMRDVMSASSYHQTNSSVERPSSAVSRPVDDIMTQSMSAIIPGSSPFGPSSSRVRRRTDLTPTVPSSHHHLLPRGGHGNSAMETSYHGSTTSSVSSRPQSASTARKTPGRAVSLSRLDQLSQPRRGRQAAGGGGPVGPPPTTSGKKQGSPATLGASDTPDTKRSMSKSMVHLGPKRPSPLSAHRRPPASAELTRSSVATAGSASAGAGNKRGAVARSMTHLAGSSSAPPVRMTRAERLRLGRLGAPVPAPAPLASRTLTLDAASASAFSGAVGRSGSTTPSTPSRPLSALSNASQVSAGGVASAGVVRRRHPPGAASAARLKPRPMSIAGTSVEQEARPRRPVGEDRALQRRDSASGQPKAVPGSAEKRTARRSSAGPTTPKKEPAGAVGASSSADNMVKAGDTGTIKRAPPKNKPSPAPKDKDAVKVNKEKKEPAESRNKESGVEEEKKQKKEEVKLDETAVVEVLPSTTRAENVDTPQEQEQESGSGEDAGNGAAGKLPKITTEEEAKAAIAERRRLAREQADREAEEQRRREEEERLAEEERQRREEEDHRKWEAEQERLMEEARKAEEERLRKAIEDAERQAEEEKRRKEEEARQKAEREEQEKKAREEAERSRLEREEKLRLEEEERQARRRKVEAIMSRTRGARSAKDGEQSGPSSSTSAASSASGNQTSIESVVAAGGTAGSGPAVAPPSCSSSSSSAAATPTTLTPSASMAMSDSMTASMYEEAARKLDEEEQQQRKLWDRGGDKAVLVNGNLSSSSSAAAVVDTNGHSQSNGDLGNGFLVDLSSLQSGVLGQNTSGNLGIDGVGVDKSSTNPFVSSLDQNNSNMASNAIDLLS